MLEIIKNKTLFPDTDLIKMVRRENNSKRNYLLVNTCQGKHVPVNPEKISYVYGMLAAELKKLVDTEKVLFIGFAETATAIAASVAAHYKNCPYIHTTREKDPDRTPVVVFSEEHSHATEQLLYCDDWKTAVKGIRHIVFIDDEVTTGKTVLNFIDALKEYDDLPFGVKFTVCSIVNGMSAATEEQFREKEVDLCWLVKIKAEPDSDETYSFDPAVKKRTSKYKLTEKHIGGKMDPRTGVKSKDYKRACSALSKEILKELGPVNGLNVAVIGTEECMYPAIITAMALTRCKCSSVVTHSTTRSPIVPDTYRDYPLASRYQVDSFYEKDRRTFIYNSDQTEYDLVVVVTDSEKEDYDFTSFANAFSLSKKFVLFRWVK
ncbi:MAG: phosphoribosyltransferase domain-containing protein [Oscillospiraceae bacterium]|nr:phosphoribosyltransferase domain-containing protein [Oscillospiraceae bacterium]